MYVYRPPGVYIEWLDRAPPPLRPRTDVAAFVGIAARGPLYEPVRLISWTQFTSVFGEHIVQGYLAYAVGGFFANGGRTCWVVRVADPESAQPAFLDLTDRDGWDSVRLLARSEGAWGNQLSATVTSIDAGRFHLVLNLGGKRQERWDSLQLQATDSYAGAQAAEVANPRNIAKVLNDCATGSRLVHVPKSPLARRHSNKLRILDRRNTTAHFRHGSDGLIGLTIDDLQKGLDALAEIEEACIIAIPDIMPKPSMELHRKKKPLRCHVIDQMPQPVVDESPPEPMPNLDLDKIGRLQHSLIAHCEGHRDRVAILDMPPAEDGVKPRTVTEAVEWRRRFDSEYAALYYPWLRVLDPLQGAGDVRTVPTCGHVAGIYARVEEEVGVHKAPANEEIYAVEDVQVALDDNAHGALNAAHVNVLRAYPGRGIRVAGGRTLSSDAAWRYINVRRLIVFLRKTIERQLSWTVFEPNNAELRRDIAQTVRAFLMELLRIGMLDDATAEEAFTVQCDEVTTPSYAVEQGQLVCEIGLQPAWPAEYIIVRFSVTDSGVEFLSADERSPA